MFLQTGGGKFSKRTSETIWNHSLIWRNCEGSSENSRKYGWILKEFGKKIKGLWASLGSSLLGCSNIKKNKRRIGEKNGSKPKRSGEAESFYSIKGRFVE
jgi:hypothetical protein